MYFDRFDIVEAWFLALSHCHEGQWSDSYRRLSGMLGYFSPAPTLTVDSLSENGREIYDGAVERLTGGAGLMRDVVT